MVVSVSFCYYAPQSPQTPQPFLLLKIECRKKQIYTILKTSNEEIILPQYPAFWWKNLILRAIRDSPWRAHKCMSSITSLTMLRFPLHSLAVGISHHSSKPPQGSSRLSSSFLVALITSDSHQMKTEEPCTDMLWQC